MDRLIGTEIGGYRIEQYSGDDPVGHLFRAASKQGGQTAVLKLIHERWAGQPDYPTRLLSSAEALAKLSHPAIVPLYGMGSENGHLYVASARTDGKSLAQLCQEQPSLSPGLAGRLVQSLAEALVYAHRQGMVHGGLYPGSILLKPRAGTIPWQPMLTDFRQVSLITGEPPPALLPYLSPEQCDGKRANGRSDVYALGVVLYQLLTGQLPFRPQTAREVVAARAPAPLRSLRPDLPILLEAITLKAMARSTAERYRSMEEFLLFLRREVDKLPVEAASSFQAAPAAAPIPSPLPSPQPQPPAQPSESDYLVISHPRLSAQTVPLHKWLITIGRQNDNDLVLSGESISAKHARLERTDQGWQVIDMGGLHGTFLENSQLLADMPEAWRQGQTLRLGEYALQWHPGRSREPTPQPSRAVEAAPDGQLYLDLTPAQFTVYPGVPAPAVLQMENQQGKTLSLTVAVTGIPDAWVAVETDPIRLAPQQKAVIPLAIHPPRHSSAKAESYSLRVELRTDNGKALASAAAQMTVAPFTEFHAEVKPTVLRHQQPAEVVVHNEGNSTATFRLAATDVNQEVLFESAEEVAIAPGESQPFSLLGRVRKRPFFLHSRLIPFELTVSTGSHSRKQPARLLAAPYISWPVLLLPFLALLYVLFTPFNLAVSGGVITQAVNPCMRPFSASNLIQVCNVVMALPPVATTRVIAADEAAAVAPARVDALSATAVPTPTPTEEPEATAVPFVEDIIIGQSFNGDDIRVTKLGHGPNSILFVGGLYAGFSPDSIALADNLILEFIADSDLVPETATVYILPLWNPDSKGGNGRHNGNNVDLNRNWHCKWQRMGDGRSGVERFSEPESQALRTFIEEIEPKAVVVWNTARTEPNYNVVSPGRCQAHQVTVSAALATPYANAIRAFSVKQADDDQTLSGDVTDSIADMGIPAVFVLFEPDRPVLIDDHLPAVLAVLAEYGR
jgi:eukaryotic-like serine/threonine-protein kinase